MNRSDYLELSACFAGTWFQGGYYGITRSKLFNLRYMKNKVSGYTRVAGTIHQFLFRHWLVKQRFILPVYLYQLGYKKYPYLKGGGMDRYYAGSTRMSIQRELPNSGIVLTFQWDHPGPISRKKLNGTPVEKSNVGFLQPKEEERNENQ